MAEPLLRSGQLFRVLEDWSFDVRYGYVRSETMVASVIRSSDRSDSREALLKSFQHRMQ